MEGLRQLMGEDRPRGKILETLALFWVFLLIGFDNGLLGPCLPDLQSSVGASLQQMSYVFFLQGSGFLLGTFLAYLPERKRHSKVDRRLLLAVYALLGSVVNVLIPLGRNYLYLLVLFTLQGVTKALCDVAAIAQCHVLWGNDKDLPLQFIVVGAGIASVLSPFIARPFIDHTEASPSMSASDDPCPGGAYNATDVYYQQSAAGTSVLLAHNSTRESLFGGVPLAPYSGGEGTHVKWPFIIVGLVTLPASAAFFGFYLANRAGDNEEEETLHNGRRGDIQFDDHLGDSAATSMYGPSSPPSAAPTISSAENSTPLSHRETSTDVITTRYVTVFRFLVILLNVPVFGLLLTFANLLTSLGMESPLCMTAAEASWLNTALWGAHAAGRAVSAAALLCVPLTVQLLVCSAGLIAVGSALVAVKPPGPGLPTSGYSTTVWVGAAGVGLFLSPCMPGYIAWSGNFIPHSPFFFAVCVCASGVGELLLPFVGGQLLAVFGSQALMIFALSVMSAMTAVFLVALCYAKRLSAYSLDTKLR